jgi:hypothetical protein
MVVPLGGYMMPCRYMPRQVVSVTGKPCIEMLRGCRREVMPRQGRISWSSVGETFDCRMYILVREGPEE